MVLGLLVVVVLAAGGYELWYLNNVYNKVTKLHGTDKKASKHLAPQIPTSSQPITALMIGSDHRPARSEAPCDLAALDPP